MLFGHLAVGIGIERVTPKTSLWILILVSTWLDIIALPFMIGFFKSFDYLSWTRGFFMSIVWSVVTFLISWMICKNIKTSITIASLVIIHWILDFIAWPMEEGIGLPLLFDQSAEGLYSTVTGIIIGEVLGIVFIFLVIRMLRKGKEQK